MNAVTKAGYVGGGGGEGCGGRFQKGGGGGGAVGIWRTLNAVAKEGYVGGCGDMEDTLNAVTKVGVGWKLCMYILWSFVVFVTQDL